MESKELMGEALAKLGSLKEKDQNSPELSEQSKLEQIEKLKKQIPDILRREVGLPKRFIREDLACPFGLEYVDKGLCLTGNTGVGKTMAISILIRDWFIHESCNVLPSPPHNVLRWPKEISKAWNFIVYPEFIMTLQDCYKSPQKRPTDWGGSVEYTALDLLDEVSRVKYLVIDDLGAEKPTEYVRQATYYIINHREMHMLPTFITTNFSMDFLNSNIDPRISSRIAGMCEIVKLEGKDRRIKSYGNMAG